MNVESVKARLKNFAIESGHTFQEALTYYGLERTIYRISVSKYAEHFILKGGIFLYGIFNRNYERVTTDIDLLTRRISNRREEMKVVFLDIFALDTEDGLVFDLDSVFVEDITEFKQYHGLHVSAVGYLGKTRMHVGIDIGFGDVIYPNTVKMDFPVILDTESPRINAYSLETAIAEKLEALIHNGYLNSRYKDFYDIYVLSRKYPFTYLKLRNAVIETFENRKTNMTMDSAIFDETFINDSIHQTRWNAFLKKKKALIQITLEAVMSWIKIFVRPLLEGSDDSQLIWDFEKGQWK